MTKKSFIKLGIIKLSRDDLSIEIDHPEHMGYQVVSKIVHGMTFEMCKSGKLTAEVESNFIESIKFFENDHEIDGITGDCGFMMSF